MVQSADDPGLVDDPGPRQVSLRVRQKGGVKGLTGGHAAILPDRFFLSRGVVENVAQIAVLESGAQILLIGGKDNVF